MLAVATHKWPSPPRLEARCSVSPATQFPQSNITGYYCPVFRSARRLWLNIRASQTARQRRDTRRRRGGADDVRHDRSGALLHTDTAIYIRLQDYALSRLLSMHTLRGIHCNGYPGGAQGVVVSELEKIRTVYLLELLHCSSMGVKSNKGLTSRALHSSSQLALGC